MTPEAAPSPNSCCRFEARLHRAATSSSEPPWGFLVLPKEASATLPRRGRTTVEGSINGQPITATLEPDGQLSHWLRVPEALRRAAGAAFGDVLQVEVRPVANEPEPDVPGDLAEALAASADALSGWHATTTLARVDWIHWIETAKQSRTRAKRIDDACRQLAQGKRRVCCFDPSGFYSKALCAPKAED